MKKIRVDEIGFGGLKLKQYPDEFCFGLDAVLAADFAAQKQADVIADLGCGTGVIPLILSNKTDDKKIIGVEVQHEVKILADENVRLNGLSEKIHILENNVKEKESIRLAINELADGYLKDGYVDAVVSNPPYQMYGCGMKSENRAKMIARHEMMASLDDFISCAEFILKNKGDFYMVHRPARLTDIIECLRKYRMEPKEMRFVAPKVCSAPNIVLVHAVKNGGKELKVLPTLYVYDSNGQYSEELMKIYEKELK